MNISNSSTSLNAKDWAKTSGGYPSESAYTESTVNLAYEITKHISQRPSASAYKLEELITSEGVLIFMESSLSSDNDDAGGNSFEPPSITGISLLGAASSNSAPTTSSQSAVCVALGKLLLELFSMSELSYDKLEGSCSDGTSGRASGECNSCPTEDQEDEVSLEQALKRQFILPDDGSKSSVAKTSLLGLGLPSSICQLVSDLLLNDEDESPCSENLALSSVKSALWDLTQMKTEPQLYLWDRTCPKQALDDSCIFGNVNDQVEHLFGREKEISVLMNTKNKISSHVLQGNSSNSMDGQGGTVFCEAVFLGGYPGSGKSTLLNPLIKTCHEEEWFVLGCKFDKTAAPHMILAKAFDDFFSEWGECSKKNDDQYISILASFQKVCQHAFAKVDGDGFNHLCELVPNFARLFPAFKTDRGTIDMQSIDKVGSANKRLQYLFHILFKSLCAAGRPILFTLDDLQWSSSVIEYLQLVVDQDASAISRDGASRQGILFLGTYRSNELVESDGLMKNINIMKDSNRVNVTMVNVTDFNQVEITELISTKLCLPFRYTQELAGIIFKKTRGNAFHIDQFMRCIIQNKMLQFSVRSRRWVWDNDVVDMQMISEGVAELLLSTFSRLPTALMQTVKIISCLGYQVEEATIDAMNSKNEVLSFDMHEQLKAAVKEGILEKAGPMYQFTHDIIQQTIYELIPSTVRHLLHKTIGESLLNSAESNTAVQLLAIDQINSFCKEGTANPEEIPRFADCNIKAAKRAMAAFSFDQAQSYIDVGMKLIGANHDTNHWETRYALSLDLFELQASVSFMRGDQASTSKYLDPILSHARTFDNTLTASSLLVKLLMSNSKFDQALLNCIAILSSLGETISMEVDPSRVQEEVSEVKALLKNITYDSIKSLPVMTNRKKILAMQFLSMLRKVCVHTKPMLLPFVGARMLKLTIDSGLCSESVTGLVLCGFIIFKFTEDMLEGYRVGKVGERLIEEHPSKHILQAKLCLELDCSLRMLAEPQHRTAAVLPHRYETTKIVGDVQNALLFRYNYCLCLLILGECHLNSAIKHTKMTLREMSKYQQHPQYLPAICLLRTSLYLAGREENDIEIKTYEEVDNFAKEKNNIQLTYHNVIYMLSQHFWMREYRDVIELSKIHPPSKHKRIMDFLQTFYIGLSSLCVARQTNDPTLRGVGEKAVNDWFLLEQLSTYNFENKSKLLQAELHYFDGEMKAAETAYKASIRSSREHKFLHEEALAYERYGMFCIENQKISEGVKQLHFALDRYRMWGAERVHDELLHKLNTLGFR